MTHRIQIFVSTRTALQAFAQELQSLLKIDFELASRQVPGRLYVWYEARPPGIWLEVFQHHLESDEDMPLEDYPYEIRLRGAIDYWVERERRLYEYAHLAFDKLKEQGKYRLMMTDDMQDIMEVFSPDT